MKKTLSIMLLGSFTALVADQYGQGYYNQQQSNGYSNQSQSNGYYNNQGQSGGYYNAQPQANVYYDAQPQSNGYNNGQSQSNNYYTPSQSTNANPYSQPGNLPEKKGLEVRVNEVSQPNAQAQPQVQPNQDVPKHIYETLYGYISDGNHNVSFEINDGVVTLTGYVNSQEEKDKVENDLKKVQGVKQIINNIKVADTKKFAYYQPTADNGTAVKTSSKATKDYAALDTDKKINAKIREKLDARGFAEVSIITANGVVTLGGVVDRSGEFVPLVLEIEKVEGVKKVNNKVSDKK